MAKGDSQNVQNQVTTQGGTAQNNLNNLWGQNTDRTTNFQNLYQPAVGQNLNDYSNQKSAYNQFLSSMPNSGSLISSFLGNKYQPQGATSQTSQASPNLTGDNISTNISANASTNPVDQLLAKYGAKDTGAGSGVTDASYWKDKYASTNDPYYLQRLEQDLQGNGMDSYSPSTGSSGAAASNADGSAPINSAISGYQNFANNGGFSLSDINAIRARSVAPIRSMADTNRNEIERQASLRGTGYSPNSIAAIAKTARDSNYAAGDTATNAEANIAQLMQQGKLYGLGGLASTGLANQGNTTANRNLDLNAILGSGQQSLSGLSGLTNLYGTTPGLSNMFGNQVLSSAGQGVQLGGLQNQLAQIIMNGQLGQASVPGNFQSALGNIGSLMSLGGSLVNPLTSLFGSSDTGGVKIPGGEFNPNTIYG